MHDCFAIAKKSILYSKLSLYYVAFQLKWHVNGASRNNGNNKNRNWKGSAIDTLQVLKNDIKGHFFAFKISFSIQYSEGVKILCAAFFSLSRWNIVSMNRKKTPKKQMKFRSKNWSTFKLQSVNVDGKKSVENDEIISVVFCCIFMYVW